MNEAGPRYAAIVQTAAELVPSAGSVETLRAAAAGCRACPLWEGTTQTVFSEGDVHAAVMLVGEQPGDREDIEGRPFVGPAGRLLDQALADAGINRNETYLTNAVKHFKFEERGKRRIHKRPSADEVGACHPWLEAEIAAVRPRVVVCLGATAAQSLLGKSFRVTRQRGQFVERIDGPVVTATVHPSSILRAPDDEARQREMALFVDDLRKVAGFVARSH